MYKLNKPNQTGAALLVLIAILGYVLVLLAFLKQPWFERLLFLGI